MKKVLVLWDDQYHPYQAIEEALAKALPASEWDVTATTDPADLDRLPADLDLLVFFSNRKPAHMPEGEWRAEGIQLQWLRRIEEGGVGALLIHAGLTGYPDRSIVHTRIARGRFIRHPEHCMTSFIPATDKKDHPVLEGVDAFYGDDEHYMCAVDTAGVEPLAYATSEHGTSIAAWTHQAGKGRVVCACPGHFKAIFNKPQMIRLMNNMARYAARGWQE